jgi:hypothetical protein
MNELYQREFVTQALQSGVPREKIAALLERAEAIAQRKTKTASAPKVDLVDDLIKNAGLQKTASSVSYTHGLLNEAFNSGANLPQAINITKQALDATAKKVVFMEKVSAINNNPKLSQYAEGFMLAAKTAGLSHDEAVSLLVDVVDREKQAGDDMFKQSPGGPPPGGQGGPAPDSDPAAGSPPGGGAGAPPSGDPSGGQGGPGASDPQEAQILQMLASLPPQEQQQIIQQLLAAISGGQGGPGGPGAGGPPPGAMGAGGPPPGAGGPPPGAGGPPGM